MHNLCTCTCTAVYIQLSALNQPEYRIADEITTGTVRRSKTNLVFIGNNESI